MRVLHFTCKVFILIWLLAFSISCGSENPDNQSESEVTFHIKRKSARTKNVAHSIDFGASHNKMDLVHKDLKAAFTLKKLELNAEELGLSKHSVFEESDGKLYQKSGQYEIEYLNNDKGIRQNFIVKGEGVKDIDFEVNLEVKTDLEARQLNDFGIEFFNEKSNQTLSYKDLICYDANGKILEAVMRYEKTGSNLYAIQISGSGKDIQMPLTIDPLVTSNSSFEPNTNLAEAGYSVEGNGDFNGDGFCDVVIGSPGYERYSLPNIGKIDIFLGTSSGVDLNASPDYTFYGDTLVDLPGVFSGPFGGKFGFSISTGRDFNNDGKSDFVVGAPLTTYSVPGSPSPDTLTAAGAFYVFYGQATGFQIDTFYGKRANMLLGYSLSGLGSINSDAFGDLAVGAPGYNNNSGLVLVHRGSAMGIGALPTDSLFGNQAGSFFGSAVTGAGDVNGDTRNDILVGAYLYNNGTDTAAGRAALYLGNPGAISNIPAWQAVGPHKNAHFGFSMDGGGNFNNAGLPDVLIGAKQYNDHFITSMPDTISNYGLGTGNGAVYVFQGSPTGLSALPITILKPSQSASGFGSSVSFAGDVDGDGRVDVLVGAPSYTKTYKDEGAAFAFYGANYQAGEDNTFDWCAFGEKLEANFGTSVSATTTCNMDGDTSSVIIGARGFETSMGVNSGAAFLYKGTACGLIKYVKPVFLSVLPDTIFAVADLDTCGTHVTFNYPDIGFNCPGGVVSVITAIDSGGFFPIGDNMVTFRLSADGQNIDTSFVVKVFDTETPHLITCPTTVSIILPAADTVGALTWTDPVFEDNSTCAGQSLIISQVSGPTKGTLKGTGVYPIVYKAVDASGNEAFCTFRVIVRKVGPDGQECSDQSITSSLVIPKTVSSAASFEFTEKLSDRFSGQRPSLGADLLISLFESVTGIDIPSWVEAAIGQVGTGINLGFVSINLQYEPKLDLTYGLFYDVDETSPTTATMDYVGQICSVKPADNFYGCRDTISMSSSFIIDPSTSFLRVSPGGLEQTVGIFIKDFTFSWYIGIDVSACIGIPLCIPFIGCLDNSCIGYNDSWSFGTNLFDPINLLQGDGLRLPLVTACDEAFMPGAGILTAVECSAGSSGGLSSFIAGLVTELGASATPADPFFYDQAKDEFVFEPNRIPLLGNRIPEMSLRFGRLTESEMNPSYINGSSLTVSGQNKNMFSATVDIFSLLYYAIPQNILNGLCASGIQIGTRTINIGIPTVEPSGMCSVKLWNTYFSIDLLDINAIIRSEYNAKYSFDPQIKIDSVDLGFSTYWERPEALVPVTGNSQKIANVQMDETIKFVVPDGQTDLFFINNDFSAEGKFTGRDDRTQNVDLGINIIELIPALRFPVSFGPLVSLGPYNLFSYGSAIPLRTYNESILIDGFSASVAMQPDSIPPVIVTRDTTVYLNEFGLAFLDAETAFNREESYDLPEGGTGKLNLIDLFPDTIYCSDYPSTTAYIVVEDDNCNFTTAAFTVTVLDTIVPKIGCQDIVVGIGANGMYILDPIEIATATDNCMNIVYTADRTVFTCADIGTTIPVIVTATDIAGNSISCSANVTIVDTLDPEIICPYLPNYPAIRYTDLEACVYVAQAGEFTPELVANDCNTQITYTLTGATTGSGVNDVAGVAFNLGTTTVTYTATDASGNLFSCSFDIVVEDNQAPILVCPMNVTISTNEDGMNDYNCSTYYTWTHPLPVDNCTDIKSYLVTCEYADGSSESEDLTDSLRAGQLSVTKLLGEGKHTITYEVWDTMDNMSACSFMITVIDDELPQIFCQEVIGCEMYSADMPAPIAPNDSSIYVIPVTNDVQISDVNVRLNLLADELSDLSIILRSPTGIEVELINQICAGENELSVLFDEEAIEVVTAACASLGDGDTLRASGQLSGFYGIYSQGDWKLIINSASASSCGTISELSLEICGRDTSVVDTVKVSILAGIDCEYPVTDSRFDPPIADNCGGATLSHDYLFGNHLHTLAGTSLPVGQTIITWTVTDGSGNTSSCVMIYEVLDQGKPYFINCPEPDVVLEAQPGLCEARVNFATPLAFDDCDGQLVVKQVDGTGLSSGSSFPVGMTILIFQAEDISGNTAQCIVRVIVNDTQPGLFACPEDVVRQTDPGRNSALVNGIAPVPAVDNCLSNNSITYQIEYPAGSGQIIGGGVADASGKVFPKDTSKVTYRLNSQPVLMISEVTQEIQAPIGGMDVLPYVVSTNDDYLEITNLGPASYNISGLIIERFGPGFSDVFEVPNQTILLPGETLVLHFGNGTDNVAAHFFNLPCALDLDGGAPAAYVASFKGRVIDVVTSNGYDPVGLGSQAIVGVGDWTGPSPDISGFGGLIRKFSFDNHTIVDFVVSENCYPLTIGELNPDMEAYTGNGTTTALQSIAPHVYECSFLVTILDLEAPQCKMLVPGNLYAGGPVMGGYDSCNESQIFIPESESCLIDSIKVNLRGSFDGTDSIYVELISPSGLVVHLLETPCTGENNDHVSFDLTLDDLAVELLSDQCGTTMWNGIYNNTGIGDSLQTLYGTTSGGTWTLRVGGRGTSDSYVGIEAWSLDILCLNDFVMADVVIDNDTLQCGGTYTWTHPYYFDNSGVGTISVSYSTTDADCIPEGGLLPGNGGQVVTAYFCVGTTMVTYTLTDGEGNTEECSFKVTVLDAEPPIINMGNCQDIVIDLGSSQCDRVVNFNLDLLTIGTDNCGVDSIAYTPASGSSFPIGITPVTLVIYDEAGNTDTCVFFVEVIEHAPSSGNFACHGNVNLSLDASCTLTITPGMILAGDDYRCYDSLCVSIIDSLGKPHENYFTLADQGYTFKVSITDCRAGGNSCWGYVKIEEKLIPGIQCPDDITVVCGTSTSPDRTGYAILTSCEPKAVIYYEDRTQNFGQCSDIQSIITRTWFIDDREGNLVSCVQKITTKAITLENIVWPADYEVENALECTDVAADPSLITPAKAGYPTIEGLVLDEGNKCLISVIYNDEIFPLCEGAYVIGRTWKILNACKPWGPNNPRVHTQAIRVFDHIAPTTGSCPPDQVIATSAWSCYRDSYQLPLPSSIQDACGHVFLKAFLYGGGKLKYEGSLGQGNLKVIATELSLGDHQVIYRVSDGCGNVTECSFVVRVVDETPPVASSKKLIVTSLTNSDELGAVAKVFAADIVNGSYDNCSAVRLEVRRPEGSACGNLGDQGHNNNSTFSDLLSELDYSNRDTDEGLFVKFCCEDAQAIVVDANEDGVLDEKDKGYHHVLLRVWDDGNMNGVVGDKGDNYNDTWSLVKVEEKKAPVLLCTRDSLYCDEAIYAKEDGLWHNLSSVGDSIDISSVPLVESLCGYYDLEFKDETHIGVCHLGYILRTWRVKGTQVSCTQRIDVIGRERTAVLDFPIAVHSWNKCELTEADVLANTYQSTKPAQYGGQGDGGSNVRIDGSGKPVLFVGKYQNVGCELFGREIFIDEYEVGTGCRKWLVRFNYINWCENADAGFRTTLFKYEDLIAPEIVTATSDTIEVDINCVVDYPVFAEGQDEGSCKSGFVWKIEWFKGDLSGSLDYVGQSIKGQIILKTLTPGLYTIRYSLTDGCGNVAEAVSTLLVRDKAPVPYCVNLSSATMKDGKVELWAKDFDRGSQSVCYPGELYFTFDQLSPVISSIQKEHYFDENGLSTEAAYLAGKAQKWVPTQKSSSKWFGCALTSGPASMRQLIEMSVWNNAWVGNSCLVELVLVDNQNVCGDQNLIVEGSVLSENGQALAAAEVILNGQLPEYPRKTQTNGLGDYSFFSVPPGLDYQVYMQMDKTDKRGVNTLDLVQIQRHILGLKSLNTPYKLIAADANGDEAIRVDDIVALRKLILGVYTNLPNSPSWRFLNASSLLGDKPWPFDEVVSHAQMAENKNDQWTAVKVGDVDGSIKLDGLQALQNRALGIDLYYEDKYIKTGEEIEIEVYAQHYADVYGWQMGISGPGMQVISFSGRQLNVQTEQYAIFKNGSATISYFEPKPVTIQKDLPVFTITVKAYKAGKLSEMLVLSDEILSTESYIGQSMITSGVKLSGRKTQEKFALYQNEPNPWRDETQIRFFLPEASDVCLSISDVTGKEVYRKKMKGTKGMNAISVSKKELTKVKGLLLYKLEAGGFSDSKKMISID